MIKSPSIIESLKLHKDHLFTFTRYIYEINNWA